MKTSANKFFLIGVAVFLFISIPITMYFVRQQQNLRSKAAATSTLTVLPTDNTAKVGDQFDLTVQLDPGQNIVSFVKYTLLYDPTKLEAINITPSDSFPLTLEGPTISSGSATISLGIGSDVTKAIQAPTQVATITFKAVGETGTTPTKVSFDPATTQVLSLSQSDAPGENVLANNAPANVTILPSDATTPTPTGNPLTPTPPTACTTFKATLTRKNGVPSSIQSHGTETITLNNKPGPSGEPGFDYVTNLDSMPDSTVTAVRLENSGTPSISIGIFSLPYVNNNSGFYYMPQEMLQELRAGTAHVQVETQNYPNGELYGTVTCSNSTVTPTPTIPVAPSPTTGVASNNNAPTCTGITISPATTGDAPFVVSITATGTDSDGTISKMTFNYGDGQAEDVTGITTAQASIQKNHTYQNPGTYNAAVVLTDDQGAVSQACTQLVTVNEATNAGSNSATLTQPPATATPRPTLAPTGNISTTLGILGGIVVAIIGGILLFAL